MKSVKFLRLLSHIVAIPAAWFATSGSGVAITSQESQPVREQSAKPPEHRSATLRGLLGSDLVPLESLEPSSASPSPSMDRVAQDRRPATPPPPPPPPPPSSGN